MPVGNPRVQRLSVIVLVVVSFAAAAWVASSLWAGLLLGVLIAFAVEPLHVRLLGRFPKRRALTGALLVLAVALVIAGFLFVLGYLLAQEVAAAIAVLQTIAGGTDGVAPSLHKVLDRIGISPQEFGRAIGRLSEQATNIVSKVVSVVLGSTFSVLAGTLIALTTAYFTLKDARPIERRLEQILPLHPRTTRELVEEFRLIGRGTLIGSAIAGLIQGAFAAIGFFIAGVPRALLLGTLTAVASLIPVFGTMIIWLPAGVILIMVGDVGAGIFELVWGALIVVTLVDYVIRPRVAGAESRSHTLMFLIGLIGGVEVLGAIGIIAGPMIMALFAAVLRIYRREVVDAMHGDS